MNGLLPIHERDQLPDTSRDAIWKLIRQEERFSVPGLTLQVPTPGTESLSPRDPVWGNALDKVREYVLGLQAAGYLQEDGQLRSSITNRPAKAYKLIYDCGVEAPRVRRDGSEVTQGRPREQMWRTMRMLGQFTIADLAIAASTDEHPVSAVDAGDYLCMLAKAGYVVCVAGGQGNVPCRYRFLPNQYTGPKPPQIQRLNSVYDPNLKRVMWHQAVRDDN